MKMPDLWRYALIQSSSTLYDLTGSQAKMEQRLPQRLCQKDRQPLHDYIVSVNEPLGFLLYSWQCQFLSR